MSKGKYSRKHGFSIRPLVLVLAVALLIGGTIGGTIAWLTAKSDDVQNTFMDSDINIKLEESDTTLTNGTAKKDFKMVPGWTIDKDPYVTVVGGSEDCWLFVEVMESTDPVLATYIDYKVNTDETGTSTTKRINNVDKTVIPYGWTRGTGTDGNGVPTNVYFRQVSASTDDQYFSVIGYVDTKGTTETADDVFVADKVLVKDTVTKDLMDEIDGEKDDGTADLDEKKPTLTFKAYAVQLYKTNAVEDDLSTDSVDESAASKFTAADAWAKRPTE